MGKADDITRMIHKDGDTPPGPLPVLGNGSVVRIKLGMLSTAIGGLIGLVFWLTIMYSNQAWIMEALRALQSDVRDLKDRK